MDPFTANNLGNFATAHSRGLRLARSKCAVKRVSFATAHSCGLRLICARVVDNAAHFATAHSCGLRPASAAAAFARLVFATAHSCGLRRNKLINACNFVTLCHSAFVRVATGFGRTVNHSRALCHSAFVRVATPTIVSSELLSDLCHSAFVRVATAEKQCSALRICCEKVDSFSSVGESGLALTIFPFSFAAKATYVAINDSFGRAIDRFFGANRTGISVSYDFAEHPCL